MQQNLFDHLYELFVADKDEDEPTSVSRFIKFCRKHMATQRISGTQYNGNGQCGLVFSDNTIRTLGDPVGGMQAPSLSVPFTAQAQQSRPATIEGWSAPFTAGPGG